MSDRNGYDWQWGQQGEQNPESLGWFWFLWHIYSHHQQDRCRWGQLELCAH